MYELHKQGNKVNNREYGVCIAVSSEVAQFDEVAIKITNMRHLTLAKDVLVSITRTWIYVLGKYFRFQLDGGASYKNFANHSTI